MNVTSKEYVDRQISAIGAIAQISDLDYTDVPSRGYTPSSPPTNKLSYGVSGIDYSNDDNWFYLPSFYESQRDLFIIYPSMVFDSAGTLLIPVTDERMASEVRSWCKFNFIDELRKKGYNIFMPKYTQFNPAKLAVSTPTVGDMLTAVENTAPETINSIKDAFAYYWNNYNGGRDFSLYTHSQGSVMALELLTWINTQASQIKTPILQQLIHWVKMGLGTTSQQISPVGFGEYDASASVTTHCYWGWDLATADEVNGTGQAHKINWGDDNTVIHHNPLTLEKVTGASPLVMPTADYKQLLCYWNYNIATLKKGTFGVKEAVSNAGGITVNLPVVDIDSTSYMTADQIAADQGIIPLAHRYDMALFMDSILNILDYGGSIPASEGYQTKILEEGTIADASHFTSVTTARVERDKITDWRVTNNQPSWFNPDYAMENPTPSSQGGGIPDDWVYMDHHTNGTNPFDKDSYIELSHTAASVGASSGFENASFQGVTLDDFVNSYAFGALKMHTAAEEAANPPPDGVSHVTISPNNMRLQAYLNMYWDGTGSGQDQDVVMQTVELDLALDYDLGTNEWLLAFNSLKITKRIGCEAPYNGSSMNSDAFFDNGIYAVPISIESTRNDITLSFLPDVYDSIKSIVQVDANGEMINGKLTADVKSLPATFMTFDRTDVTLPTLWYLVLPPGVHDKDMDLAIYYTTDVTFDGTAHTINMYPTAGISMDKINRMQVVI